MISHYETLTGRRLDLDALTDPERNVLGEVIAKFRENLPWDSFSNLWQRAFTALPSIGGPRQRLAHPLYKAFQDMEMRLGVAQGDVAPPDYRDYIVDRIEQKFGTRYKFCQATSIPEAFLSQVLSGKKDFSLSKLKEVAQALDLSIVLLPNAEVLDAPLTDLAAMKRVTGVMGQEIATLVCAIDHLTRIKDPVRRAKALDQEKELFESVLDRVACELKGMSDAERGEKVLPLLQKERESLEFFLCDLRRRIANAAEPEARGVEARLKNGAHRSVSRV